MCILLTLQWVSILYSNTPFARLPQLVNAFCIMLGVFQIKGLWWLFQKLKFAYLKVADGRFWDFWVMAHCQVIESLFSFSFLETSLSFLDCVTFASSYWNPFFLFYLFHMLCATCWHVIPKHNRSLPMLTVGKVFFSEQMQLFLSEGDWSQ